MEEKEKRQKRFQQKNRHIDRQSDIYSHIMKSEPKNRHKFHKKNALTCGNSNCYMCGNPRKFFNEKTIQEKRFECIEE
jgi:ribosomal protein L44E